MRILWILLIVFNLLRIQLCDAGNANESEADNGGDATAVDDEGIVSCLGDVQEAEGRDEARSRPIRQADPQNRDQIHSDFDNTDSTALTDNTRQLRSVDGIFQHRNPRSTRLGELPIHVEDESAPQRPASANSIQTTETPQATTEEETEDSGEAEEEERAKRSIQLNPHRGRRSEYYREDTENIEEDTAAESYSTEERRRKRSAAEQKARFHLYLQDEDNHVNTEGMRRMKRQAGAELPFAYDINVADEPALTASQKQRSSKKNTVDADVSDDPTVTAFDVVVPEWEARTQLDPRGFRSAMAPALVQSRNQVASTLSGLISRQCFVQDDGGSGFASDITKYAYQSELAARQLADKLTGGDARDLFANLNKLNSRMKNNKDCYEEDDLECDVKYPFRKMDGTCNNINHPRWGSASATQNRFVSPSYEDQISTPRTLSVTSHLPDRQVPLPDARKVSTTISTNIERPNKKITALFNQWSQFIAHDVIRTPTEKIRDPNNPDKTVSPKCCFATSTCANNACFPINIPSDDRVYGSQNVGCLEFARAQAMPKPQCQLGARLPVNEETAFIDGSHIYGWTDDQAMQLRSKKKGRLRINTSPIVKKQGIVMVPGGPDGGACTAPDSQRKCPMAGDNRVTQHTGLVAMHSLLLRVHNWIATFLSEQRPKASDDAVYLLTRKIVGAMIQHITYNEMLPIIVGKSIYDNPKNQLALSKKGFCDCYDEDVDASIYVEFGASSFRFHTLISNWLPARDPNGVHYPLYQHFNNPAMFYKEGILDEILTGMPDDIPETTDPEFSYIMQNQLFKPKNVSFGGDMLSNNIQRGRDQGLATYNDVRKFCGLRPFNSFHDLEAVMP